MHHFKVRGAIIISILVLTGISAALGLSEFKGVVGAVPSIAPTFMQMSFEGLFTASLIGVIFVFFLVDLFDSTGTLGRCFTPCRLVERWQTAAFEKKHFLRTLPQLLQVQHWVHLQRRHTLSRLRV